MVLNKIRFKKLYITKRLKSVLLVSKKSKNGRNNLGNLIISGVGNCSKRFYRLIDFNRKLYNLPSRIHAFEFDPNRNIYITLLIAINGIMFYILTPMLVRLNMFLYSGIKVYMRNGNHTMILNCPVGSLIHNIQINLQKAIYARSAGTFIQIVRKFGCYVLSRFPSKEERFYYCDVSCTYGRLANENHKLYKYSKAGDRRRRGFKSNVRGVVKNPIDHPHGGGSGRTTAGQPSVSRWGIYTKGIRTTTRFTRFNLTRWGFFRRRTKSVWRI